MVIHFYSADKRFCGSNEPLRSFTLDPNEVTCEACKAQDIFELTPEALAYLKELGEP